MHLKMNFNNSFINFIAVCITYLNLFQCYSKTYFKLNFENSAIFYSFSISFKIIRFNDIACINNCKLKLWLIDKEKIITCKGPLQ